jgi:hypothetical protein
VPRTDRPRSSAPPVRRQRRPTAKARAAAVAALQASLPPDADPGWVEWLRQLLLRGEWVYFGDPQDGPAPR